ncbi:MAG TPA: radical SAM protein [Smithellaceae bacterium]|nr:radical SAM protein [Smithellaceae bacterium]HQM45286.1 radical SAM protein [Smithellaceae bacterium]
MIPLKKENNQRRLAKNPFRWGNLFSINSTISKLYIEPTTQCNLQCRTCIRNSWEEQIGSMDMFVYRKLLSDLKTINSVNSIAFWGFGEPLAHPEITYMVALAHEMDLKTEIITNGHLLDGDMARDLMQAGLDTVVVSMDGTTQTSYANIRHGGDFQRVMENIRTLNILRAKMSRRNPSVGLEFVIMKSNINQLPDLAQSARSMDADFIVLTNLLPCTEDMKDEILYWISATSNYKGNRLRLNHDQMLPRLDLHREYLSPILELFKRLNMTMPEIRNVSQEEYCPFIQKGSAAITWAGDVSPCIALMHSYRCYILGREKLIKRYLVGNIAQEKIDAIWKKKNYRSFRDRVLKFDFAPCVQCGGCDFNEANEEDCIGNVHPVCGDCLWARNVLQCP